LRRLNSPKLATRPYQMPKSVFLVKSHTNIQSQLYCVRLRLNKPRKPSKRPRTYAYPM
jgi:hypothetical protein